MKKNFCSLSHIQLAFGFTLFVSGAAIGQMRVVTGIVTENNKPISRVSVFQEGSDAVAVSDASGVYRVQVTGNNPVLVYRHPDYPERKMTLGNKLVVNVTFGNSSKENEIEEVILNAGYYRVNERESTGSIVRITAKDIENQPVNNVLQSAQGRMTGVSITQNSGVAGGGYDVQIRGRNSLRSYGTTGYDGNKPLYVVDGVPLPSVNDFNTGMAGTIFPYSDTNPLNSINPDDIESFEVLKDADATAIYGSKGANGVILISTKRGKKERTEVNVKTSYGLGDMTNLPKMMSLDEYTVMRKLAFANDGVAIPANAYDINGRWDDNKSTDWQKYFVGNKAEFSDVQIGVSGGSGGTQFSFSAGHNEETTVFPGDYRYKRNNVGVNVQHSSADRRFKIGFSGLGSFQDNVLPPTDFNAVYSSLAPNAPELYKNDGSINWENNTFNNPMGPATQIYTVNTKSLNTNLSSSYLLGYGFTVNLNAGYSIHNAFEQQIFPKF